MSPDELDDAQVAVVARAVINTICELDTGAETVRLSTGRQACFLMGWWVASCRLGRGVVLLADADLAYETASLLRGMVEHYVLMELVSRDPDAWRIVERARQFKLKQFEGWLAEHNYPSWEELTSTREQLSLPSPADNPKLDHLATFKEQCRQLGPMGDVSYARFQFLTHHAHASNESAMTFVPLSGCDCRVCLGFRPLDPPTPEGLAALILLDGAALLNKLVPSKPWTDVLREMEAACEPIRWAMGGPPFHVDRPSPD